MITPLQKSLSLLTLFAALLATSVAAEPSSFDLRSPDNRIEVRIRTTHQITYDVLLKGRALLLDCPLSLDIDHKKLGPDAKVVSAKNRSYDQVIEPPVRQKFANILDNYNELRLEMAGGFAVTFRPSNQGAAYRFQTSLRQAQGKAYGAEVRF